MLSTLENLIKLARDRKTNPVEGSYTNKLLEDKSLAKEKVLEEINELIEAVEQDTNKIHEAADVLYHLLIYLETNKIKIEALWNQLVYSKYSKNIRINEEELRKNVIIQSQNKKKKFEYNFSEILFTEKISESFEETVNRLENSIKDIGFENTANIFSISSTSKNGGLIGWVNELQISKILKKNITQLQKGEVSDPIKISGGYLIIKLNDKKQFEEEIDIDKQIKELIAIETNRQLNTYSAIFYKRLKKNIKINEL